ncbi:MAG: hypothetical protein M0P31_01290 [Solirubrobacteraceae bacterium]|nr:hypothetical protein [Solirubrobacteraceae bacterium]
MTDTGDEQEAPLDGQHRRGEDDERLGDRERGRGSRADRGDEEAREDGDARRHGPVVGVAGERASAPQVVRPHDGAERHQAGDDPGGRDRPHRLVGDEDERDERGQEHERRDEEDLHPQHGDDRVLGRQGARLVAGQCRPCAVQDPGPRPPSPDPLDELRHRRSRIAAWRPARSRPT